MAEAIKGITSAIRKMKNRGKDFQSRRGPYTLAGRVLAESIDKNFNAEGRPQWDLRIGTYYHPILDHTGKMRDTAVECAKGTWRIRGIDHTLEIHSPLRPYGGEKKKPYPYGRIHQITGMPTLNHRSKPYRPRKFIKLYGKEHMDLKKPFRKAFLQKR